MIFLCDWRQNVINLCSGCPQGNLWHSIYLQREDNRLEIGSEIREMHVQRGSTEYGAWNRNNERTAQSTNHSTVWRIRRWHYTHMRSWTVRISIVHFCILKFWNLHGTCSFIAIAIHTASRAVNYSNASSKKITFSPRKRAQCLCDKYAKALTICTVKVYCISIWSRRMCCAWPKPVIASKSLTLAWHVVLILRKNCKFYLAHQSLLVSSGGTTVTATQYT